MVSEVPYRHKMAAMVDDFGYYNVDYHGNKEEFTPYMVKLSWVPWGVRVHSVPALFRFPPKSLIFSLKRGGCV